MALRDSLFQRYVAEHSGLQLLIVSTHVFFLSCRAEFFNKFLEICWCFCGAIL
jgi:hypothetical protein